MSRDLYICANCGADVSHIGCRCAVSDPQLAKLVIKKDAEAALTENTVLVVALTCTLKIFKTAMGDTWPEWDGTSKHGPAVRNEAIVEAIELLKKYGVTI